MQTFEAALQEGGLGLHTLPVPTMSRAQISDIDMCVSVRDWLNNNATQAVSPSIRGLFTKLGDCTLQRRAGDPNKPLKGVVQVQDEKDCSR
jgi:hypothetical protein